MTNDEKEVVGRAATASVLDLGGRGRLDEGGATPTDAAEEGEEDSPVRRELLLYGATGSATATMRRTTGNDDDDDPNYSDDKGSEDPIRHLPSSILSATCSTQHFKLFHLQLLEHLYENEDVDVPCDPVLVLGASDVPQSKKKNPARSAMKHEMSLARKFLEGRPDLIARREEATRLAGVHEEAKHLLCPADPDHDELPVSKKRKISTSGHPTPITAGKPTHARASAVGPVGMMSPSFRIVEFMLRRRAEHAAHAWSTRQSSAVAPLLAAVRRRIAALQVVQKHQQQVEQDRAQRLIDQLLSTNPKRTSGTGESATESPVAENSSNNDEASTMSTALKLRLWNLLRQDLEALVHE